MVDGSLWEDPISEHLLICWIICFETYINWHKGFVCFKTFFYFQASDWWYDSWSQTTLPHWPDMGFIYGSSSKADKTSTSSAKTSISGGGNYKMEQHRSLSMFLHLAKDWFHFTPFTRKTLKRRWNGQRFSAIGHPDLDGQAEEGRWPASGCPRTLPA